MKIDGIEIFPGKMKWINPKERLPEVGEEIFALVTWRVGFGSFLMVGRYECVNPDGNPRARPYGDSFNYIVLAWMPVPDDPDWLEEEVSDEYEL